MSDNVPKLSEGRWQWLLGKAKAGMKEDNMAKIEKLLGPEGKKFGKVFQSKFQAIWHTMEEFIAMFNGRHPAEVDEISFLEVEIELNRMMSKQTYIWKLMLNKFENPWSGVYVLEPWVAYGLMNTELVFLDEKADKLAIKLRKLLEREIDPCEHCKGETSEPENSPGTRHVAQEPVESDPNCSEEGRLSEDECPELENVDSDEDEKENDVKEDNGNDDFTSSFGSDIMNDLGLQEEHPCESSPISDHCNVKQPTSVKNRSRTSSTSTVVATGSTPTPEPLPSPPSLEEISKIEPVRSRGKKSLPGPKAVSFSSRPPNDVSKIDMTKSPGRNIKEVIAKTAENRRQVEQRAAKNWNKKPKRNSNGTPPHSKRAKTNESEKLLNLTKQLEECLQLAQQHFREAEEKRKDNANAPRRSGRNQKR